MDILQYTKIEKCTLKLDLPVVVFQCAKNVTYIGFSHFHYKLTATNVKIIHVSAMNKWWVFFQQSMHVIVFKMYYNS